MGILAPGPLKIQATRGLQDRFFRYLVRVKSLKGFAPGGFIQALQGHMYRELYIGRYKNGCSHIYFSSIGQFNPPLVACRPCILWEINGLLGGQERGDHVF